MEEQEKCWFTQLNLDLGGKKEIHTVSVILHPPCGLFEGTFRSKSKKKCLHYHLTQSFSPMIILCFFTVGEERLINCSK